MPTWRIRLRLGHANFRPVPIKIDDAKVHRLSKVKYAEMARLTKMEYPYRVYKFRPDC